jgi:hypothetical protein
MLTFIFYIQMYKRILKLILIFDSKKYEYCEFIIYLHEIFSRTFIYNIYEKILCLNFKQAYSFSTNF